MLRCSRRRLKFRLDAARVSSVSFIFLIIYWYISIYLCFILYILSIMCKIGEMLPFFPRMPALSRSKGSVLKLFPPSWFGQSSPYHLTVNFEWQRTKPWTTRDSATPASLLQTSPRAPSITSRDSGGWKGGPISSGAMTIVYFRLRPGSARVDRWKQSSTGSL